MFISALGSITGKQNRLGLPKVKSACVVLVDGLGSQNLKFRAAHAPFLANQLSQDGSTFSGFPSTTVTSLVSFSTGLRAGQHGMVGYQVYDRAQSTSINLLTGMMGADQAMHWQPTQTIAELSGQYEVETFFVGPGEYEKSGFTFATMRGATFVAAKSLDDRVREARRLLKEKSSALVYLYVPELDQNAHAFGFKSAQWAQKLEDLDLAIKNLVTGLGEKIGVLLTADHGIIDVAHEKQIYLDEFEIPGLEHVGGDPRVIYLYLSDVNVDDIQESLQAKLGKRVFVATKAQLIEAGWYGPVEGFATERLPELILISLGETALYHRDFAKPKSLQMIGQHGSISDEEITIPLLKFCGYSKKN